MPLAPGDKLGPYEILAPIGKGGMGEVYKAHDSRLNRDVAIKVSSAEFSERFEREARAVAALNHSNICTLYDVGPNYIVMEHIEGAPLKGPLPLDQALKYAMQICDALSAAHKKGITHRDLKPANIMVTKAGIKLLDFGLAKFAQSTPAMGPDDATIKMALTGKTEILGTLYYMSPEQLQSQASGAELDNRSDIFSFGLVLYEMITGKRAFDGASAASVIAAIMERPAPSLGSIAPPALDRVLQVCLAKDPDDRWQTARDLKRELERVANPPAEVSANPVAATSRVKWLWPAIAGFFALVAVAVLWAWAGRTPAPVAVTRASILLPENRPLSVSGSPTRSLALSPDGTQLVYVGTNLDAPADQPGGRTLLLLRSLSTLAVRDLPGTTGARQPFFSPDGLWVAFFTGSGELKKVSLSGGNPVTLAQKISGSAWSFGVWTDDNTIVFKSSDQGLLQVSSEGGAVAKLASLTDAANPALVPSSRTILFYRIGSGSINAFSFDSNKSRVVLENANKPFVLSSGHLLFQRGEELLIAPFDLAKQTVIGPALPFIEKVLYSPGPLPQPELSISRNGMLAYVPAAETEKVLGLVGRDGKFQPLGLPPANFSSPRVSPDGRFVAFLGNGSSGNTVHVYDLQRGSTTKLALESSTDGFAWHPDGRSMAINTKHNGTSGIYLRNQDGSMRLLVPNRGYRNFSWSPDGTKLAYTVQVGSLHDIWIMTMGEKPTLNPFLNTPASEFSPQFSPDGRWLAYVSDESGRYEVYVQQYPQGERFSVSILGGNGPRWRRDGKEIYFEGLAEGVPKMMAVAVTPAGGSLRFGKPEPLFDMRVPGLRGSMEEYRKSGNDGPAYDVLPDGRFLMIRGSDSNGMREIVLVQNWFEELKRLAPAK